MLWYMLTLLKTTPFFWSSTSILPCESLWTKNSLPLETTSGLVTATTLLCLRSSLGSIEGSKYFCDWATLVFHSLKGLGAYFFSVVPVQGLPPGRVRGPPFTIEVLGLVVGFFLNFLPALPLLDLDLDFDTNFCLIVTGSGYISVVNAAFSVFVLKDSWSVLKLTFFYYMCLFMLMSRLPITSWRSVLDLNHV